MKCVIKCCIGFCFIVFFASEAFIYDIQVLRKWSAADGHYVYFVGLGDFHDKKHQITAEQKTQIDAFMRRCPEGKTIFFVEDIGSRGDNGCQRCGKFIVNSRGGILGGMVADYKAKGVKDISNIEYRFCRVAALAPVINNLSVPYHSFASSSQIKVGQLYTEVVKACNEILQYQDGLFLSNLYKHSINNVQQHMKQLKLKENAQYSVADYLAKQTNGKDKLYFIKHLLTFDTPLIELKMLNAIQSAAGKQNIVAIAGGTHTKKVCSLLRNMGYELLYSTDPQYMKEYNLQHCLGSHIFQSGYCHKPHPVDVKVLDRFF